MSDGLSILQVITTVDVGGAEKHLLALVEGLERRGHSVDVAYLKGDGTLASRFAAAGADPIRVPIDGVWGPLGAVLGVRRLCRQRGYDLVHTHLLKANVVGGIGARLGGVPTVVASKHNDEPQLTNGPIAALHGRLSRRDCRVIHSSRHIMEYMKSVGRVDPEKSSIVRYGVEPQSFPQEGPEAESTLRSSLRRSLGIEDGGFLVVCVARLVERKGHLTLLEAIRRVADAGGKAAVLIVGKGPMEETIRQRASAVGIADRTHMLGERLDVTEVLRAADLFVLPSTAEGLGLVVLEAMEASLPVVGSRVGGIPEMIDEAESGFLVTPAEPTELAERILAMERDPDLARRLGERGHEIVTERFSLDAMLDGIEATYRSALERC